MAEGFTGPRITEVTNPIYDITLSNLDLPVTVGPKPGLELLLVGRNNADHEIEVFVGPDAPGLTSIGTFSFNGYNMLKIPFSAEWSMITGGSLLVRVEVINNGNTQSNVSVSYLTLNYSRQTDMVNANFLEANLKIQVSGGNVTEFINAPLDSKVYEITDPVNVKKIVDTDFDPNTITFGFSDATVARKMALAVPGNSFTMSKIGSFKQIDASLYNYLIISNKVLMQPAGGETDAVKAYAAIEHQSLGVVMTPW